MPQLVWNHKTVSTNGKVFVFFTVESDKRRESISLIALKMKW